MRKDRDFSDYHIRRINYQTNKLFMKITRDLLNYLMIWVYSILT